MGHLCHYYYVGWMVIWWDIARLGYIFHEPQASYVQHMSAIPHRILLVSLKKQSILQQAHTHTLRWEHAGFMACPQSLLPLYHCSSILIDSVLVSRFLSRWYLVPILLTYGVFTTSAASSHFYIDSYGVNRIHPTKKQLKRSRKACT